MSPQGTTPFVPVVEKHPVFRVGVEGGHQIRRFIGVHVAGQMTRGLVG
jgi:hypothetical protein